MSARRATHAFHGTGAHYINGDTTAFMQFLTGDLFKDFPTLKFIIPAWRRRGALSLGPLSRPGAGPEEAAARRDLMNNVFFDTCVYHLPASNC
jgi:4-oxalmesaconate hydratase